MAEEEKGIVFPKFSAKRAAESSPDGPKAGQAERSFAPNPHKRVKAKDFLYYIHEPDEDDPKSDSTYNYRVDKCGIINGETQPPSETYRIWGEDTEELPLMCSCPSSMYGHHPNSRECKHIPWVREVIEAQQEFVDVTDAHYDTREERVIFPKNT